MAAPAPHPAAVIELLRSRKPSPNKLLRSLPSPSPGSSGAEDSDGVGKTAADGEDSRGQDVRAEEEVERLSFPLADWRPMDALFPPPAREGHSAELFQSSMLVFGGVESQVGGGDAYINHYRLTTYVLRLMLRNIMPAHMSQHALRRRTLVPRSHARTIFLSWILRRKSGLRWTMQLARRRKRVRSTRAASGAPSCSSMVCEISPSLLALTCSLHAPLHAPHHATHHALPALLTRT